MPKKTVLVPFLLVVLSGSFLFGTSTSHAAIGSEGNLADGPATTPERWVLPGLVNDPNHAFRVWVENTSASASQITVAYYNQDGSLVPGGVETLKKIPAGSHGSFPFDSTVLPSPWRGLAVVFSDESVAAIAREWPANAANSGSNAVLAGYPVSSDAGSMVSLPYVSNDLEATYNTLITVANRGARTACVQVTYSFVPATDGPHAAGHPNLIDTGPGGGGCATGYPINPNGQLTLGPDGAGPSVTPMPSETQDWLMSATVTSTGSPVAAAVYAYLTNGLKKGEWYAGFAVKPPASGGIRSDDLGTEISIPIALKTANGYYSQILISNPNPDAAVVSIDYATGGQTYTAHLTVPANGVANHSVYSDDVVPVGFVGAATVHSSQPVAAVVFRSKMTTAYSFEDEDLYTAMDGVPVTNGSKTVYFPYVVRRENSDADHAGYNSWESVSVVGGGTANLTITTIGQAVPNPPCSTADAFTVTKQITGSFVFYQNADADNGLGYTPSCLVGTMTITSDVPIIAVADVVNDRITGDTDGGYNGQRGPS